MIREVKGDILESEAPIIVVPVNCKGVMGKGLALQAKQKWPKVYESYKSFCEGACPSFPNGLEPGGGVFIQHVPNKYIACLATKDDWRNPSKLEWVEEGLKQLVATIKNLNAGTNGLFEFGHIALPKVGCGLGGLDWCDVKPIVYRVFENTPITVDLYDNN